MKQAIGLAGILAAGTLLFGGQAYAANAKNGASIFNRCAICHSNTKGAAAKIGPNLFGIVGRKAGSQPNFSYSGAMKSAGFVWTADKLTAYVQHPAVVVPGNRMAFAGISRPADAADVVAYLATLK